GRAVPLRGARPRGPGNPERQDRLPLRAGQHKMTGRGDPMRRAGRVLAAAAALLSAAGDWPQFLGPHRDSHSAAKGLIQRFPRGGPKALWQADVGEGHSGPVVAGDRLILFHRVGDDDIVACLDAAAGKEKWTFKYATAYVDRLGKGDGPRSTPLIAGK